MPSPRVCVGLLGLLIACSGPTLDEDARDGRFGGTLVIGAPTDISDVSPLTFQVQNALYIQQFVLFLPLLAYDAELRPVPRLARSWEVNTDSSRLTFHLRRDVRWHDGQPTTAFDVQFSYERARDARTAYIYSGLFEPYGAGEVVDSFTWTVELRPHADFLDVWRVFPPVPRHILADTPPEELRHHAFGTRQPVGNGPFRFLERRPGDRWIFEANPDFPEELGGRPFVDRLVYRVIPEQAALLTELVTGGIDFYPRLPPQSAAAVERAGARLVRAPDRSWTHIVWNHRRPPFDDVRVRRALTLGIDREALVQAVRSGYGSVANSTVAPVYRQHDSTAGADLRFDTTRARSLLAEAGLLDRDGDGVLESSDGRPFRFSLSVPQGYPERQAAATVVQSDLRRLGIAVEVRVMEFNTLIATAGDADLRDFDAMIISWEPEFRIDDAQLFGCAHSRSPVAFTGYCSPRTDALLDSLTRTADPVAARPLWHRYQHHIAAEQPVTFLFFIDELHAVAPRVRDASPDARGDWVGVERWWLERS